MSRGDALLEEEVCVDDVPTAAVVNATLLLSIVPTNGVEAIDGANKHVIVMVYMIKIEFIALPVLLRETSNKGG